VAVFYALIAGRGSSKIAGKVGLYCRTDSSGRAGCRLDTEIRKKLNGTPAHAATQDDVGILLLDEPWDLPGGVTITEGVRHAGRGSDLVVYDIDEDEVGRVSEMLRNHAFQTIVVFCSYCDFHVMSPD
jgi:hypothetical protein